MAKARFAYSNLLTASGVVISASGEASGRPASNAANPARWKKWRSGTYGPLATPGAPTVTPQGTTGATTYGYKIVAKNGSGDTLASAEGTTAIGNATLSGTNFNRVTWAAVSGATSYDVYRTTGGGTQGKVGNAAGTTFDDTGLAASGTTPTANTSGDQWIKFDLGSNKSMQAFLMADWKAHGSGGTIKVQANATDVWTSPTVDQAFTLPASNPTKVVAVWLGASQSLRWVRFYFTNVGVVSDYVELGVAFAGPYFGPQFNLSDGYGFTRRDLSMVVKSDGGNVSTYKKNRYHDVRATFEYVGTSDKANFMTMYETVGAHTPLFFAIDPDDPDQIVYGNCGDELDIRHVTRSYFNVGVPFAEAL